MSSAAKAKNNKPADARITRASGDVESNPPADLDTSLEERIDHRLTRMEQAIEAMAASVAQILRKKDKKKRSRDTESNTSSKKKKSK